MIGHFTRDAALLTVVFRTTNRGDGLSRTLIQRILRPPKDAASAFNFQWGKTMRDGTDHPMTAENDTIGMATCPIRAICAKLEYNGGVLFPEGLPTAERGSVY